MIISIIISVVVYVLSILYVRKWIRKAHSKGGKWQMLDITETDVLFTIFPVVNTILAFTMLFKSPYENKDSQENINKFFGVKNNEN